MVWKARVKKLDITFSVKEVREVRIKMHLARDNSCNVVSYLKGMEPFILEPATKCTADMPIQGRIAPVSDRPRSIVLHFDNAYSAALQGKIIVYWVAVGENVSLADDQVSLYVYIIVISFITAVSLLLLHIGGCGTIEGDDGGGGRSRLPLIYE